MFKFFAWVIMALSLVGCQQQDYKVKIGLDPWAGYLAAYTADKKNFYEQEGLKDTDVRVFPTSIDSIPPFTNGRLDVVFTGIFVAIKTASLNPNFKVVLVTSRPTADTNVIVSQPNITNVSQLRGKRIGLEVLSMGNYYIHQALESAGIPINQVTLVNVRAGEDAVNYFKAKKVDAIITWPPISTNLVKNGGHIIWKGSNVLKAGFDVMLMRKDFIENHPEEAQKVVNAYLNTVNWIAKNKSEAMEIMAKAANQTPADFERDYNTEIIVDPAAQIEAFGPVGLPAKGTINKQVQDIIDFSYNQHIISRYFPASDMIEPKFIWGYAKKYEIQH